MHGDDAARGKKDLFTPPSPKVPARRHNRRSDDLGACFMFGVGGGVHGVSC
jgi:hypothetical protein